MLLPRVRASRSEVATHRQSRATETPHGKAGGPEGAQARREERKLRWQYQSKCVHIPY